MPDHRSPGRRGSGVLRLARQAGEQILGRSNPRAGGTASTETGRGSGAGGGDPAAAAGGAPGTQFAASAARSSTAAHAQVPGPLRPPGAPQAAAERQRLDAPASSPPQRPAAAAVGPAKGAAAQAPPDISAGEYSATARAQLGIRGRLLAGLLTLLLGFAIAVQVRATGDDQLLARASRADLVRILDGLNQRSTALEQEIVDLEATKRELQSGADAGRTAIEAATDRARTLGVLAGTVAATGPGVVLEIRDPSLVVPASVLLSAVQELRDAGAEAIQIRGSDDSVARVVVNTFFLDEASGALVGGVAVPPPYQISAIGDPATLATAMNIPGGIVAEVDTVGGTASVRESNQVVIDAVVPAQRLN